VALRLCILGVAATRLFFRFLSRLLDLAHQVLLLSLRLLGFLRVSLPIFLFTFALLALLGLGHSLPLDTLRRGTPQRFRSFAPARST
jgi:hypothetical protein